MQKKLPLILIIIAVMIFLQLNITASVLSSAVIIPDISKSLITSQLDYRIDNFNSSASNWTAGENVQLLDNAQVIAPYPFAPFEGLGCLSVQSAPSVLNGWRYITKNFVSGYNLSESNIIFAAVNLPDLAVSYDVTLIMDGYTSTASGCKPGKWNGVFFDISDYAGKSAVTSITIGVRFNSPDNYNSEYIYYIDTIGAFRNADIVSTMRYLSSDYYTSGGSLIKGTDRMTLEINDENPYIETYSFNPEILSDPNINSIKIKLKNNSDCKAVSFYYTTPRNPAFSQERSYITATETDGDIQICYFPLTAGSVDQIRILFNGATQGEIEIYSITPSSSYIPTATGYGTVDECTIAANKKEINVSGTLTEDAYEDFRGIYLELYALGIHEDVANVINHNLTPVAQVRADRSFSFAIPFDDNVRHLISSKFIVVADTGGEQFIIDTPKYITNPDILAVNKYTNTKSNIKKGMTSFVTESQINGVKHTYLTINLNNLITLDDTGSVYQHIVDGHTYYFSADYITSLDASLIQYCKANIAVTAVMNLKLSSSDNVNNILIHPDADRTNNVSGYAFNTTTAEGVRYLRAIFDFLARRYSSDNTEYGRIANYVIGNKVGLAYQNYNMGGKTLAQFTEIYAAAVRIAYNTVKSVSSAANIYISLDYTWDNDLPADNLLRYDNRVLLDTLSAYFRGHGDINWNLVFDMYPHDANGIYTPWNAASAVNRYDSGIITARNIEMLCRYMLRQQLWYITNATPRSVILIENSILPAGASETDIALYTAGYTYSFYKINMRACTLIDSYIVNRSSSADFMHVFKYIDTDRSLTESEHMKPIIGIADWAEIINSFDAALITRRNMHDKGWTAELPDTVTGSALMWQFSDSENADGWTAAEYCNYITSDSQFYSRSSLLKIQLGQSAVRGEYRGIENILPFSADLSVAPFLSFTTQISMLPNNITSAELVIFVQSGDNYIVSSGIITAGEWNSVVLDMTEFAGLKSLDSMKIWLRGIDGQTDIGEPVIFISDIMIHSAEFDSEYIVNNLQTQRELHLSSYARPIDMRYVWVLTTVIIVATSLLIINILSRRKVTETEDDWYNDRRY